MHQDSVLLGRDILSVDNQIPKALLLQHSTPEYEETMLP